jgi:hypothetical protein
MARYLKILTGFFFLIVFGCTEDRSIMQKDYYPLSQNNSLSYAVEEKNYSLTSGEKKTNYYIKETIGQPIGTINEKPIYSLMRYRKFKPEDGWVLDSLWTIYKQLDKVVKIENNIPYVKLILPSEPGKTWNGNSLNTLPNKSYKIFRHPEGIEVVHYNDSNAIELNRSREIYSPGIGMTYKEITHFKYCQSSSDCIGKGIVSSGKSIIYKFQ